MSRSAPCRAALLSLSVFAGASCLHAGPPRRLGSEFQVNTHTLLGQRYTDIARDTDGDFVVTWMSLSQDGDGNGLFARRFNSDGLPQGVEVQVNTNTVNNPRYPAVAMD